METRIENEQVKSRIVSPIEASKLIQNGMTVAMGGYTSSGYPKVIANELVKRKMAGEDLFIHLITGANVGPLDDVLSKEKIIARRTPMCASKILGKQINSGQVHYVEQQMNKMPRLIQSNSFGKIDVAVVEALGITKEGFIIPTSSIGMTPHLLNQAKEIIVEINIAQPRVLEGMHDVYVPSEIPNRLPIPLTSANQKIGEPFIRVNPDKIRYVVESNILDATSKPAEITDTIKKISENLFDFLEIEVIKTFKGYLPPFQTGFGNLATGLVNEFKNSNFKDIQFFCGILGEANIDLMLTGKVKAASTGSIEMTPKVIDIIKKHSDFLKNIMVIRNGDITNNSEIIQRLGVITLNSAIEVDIYGNVNSSHISGSKIVNGIGGGANFAQSAGLSIILLPSVSKGGAISNIVPMVFHQDICEHDVDILITENGVADLRGKDEVERAKLIIQNCASDTYREQITNYLNKAIAECGGHRPQLPLDAYKWYERLKKKGTMKNEEVGYQFSNL